MSKGKITDVGVCYLRMLKNGNPELIIEGSEQLFARNKDVWGLHRKAVVFHISEGDEIPSDIEDIMSDVPIDKQTQKKSASQRLRGILYHLHVEQGGNKDDFDDFYQFKMNELINHFSNKLDQLKT